MTDQNNESKYKRFYRDGPSYYDDFEMVLSNLFGESSSEHQGFIDILIELIQNIHGQMGECHEILGSTETLVEEARARGDSPEQIEKLVDICRKLQSLETHLAESVKQGTSKMTDKIFPR